MTCLASLKISIYLAKLFKLVPHFIVELNPGQAVPGGGLCLIHSCEIQTLSDVVVCSLVP